MRNTTKYIFQLLSLFLFISCTVSVSAQWMQPGNVVVSCLAGDDDVTLAVMDISQLGTLWMNPTNHNIDQSSNVPPVRKFLASDFEGNWIFSTAIDQRDGTIFASPSALYSPTSSTPSPIGQSQVEAIIFKIDPINASVTRLATLPGELGIGYIAMDTLNDLIYATNIDNGIIYSVDLNGNIQDTYDFGIVDATGDSKFPVLGDRVLGVDYNYAEGRLYYSVWSDNRFANGSPNTIRSIQIDASGNFVPASDQLEITIPNSSGLTFSQPGGDIEFNEAGDKVLIAENPFVTLITGTDTLISPSSHDAKLNCREKSGGAWIQCPNYAGNSQGTFDIGNQSTYDGLNSRGGTDWAYESLSGCILQGDEDYVVTTGDFLKDITLYGFQFTPTTGGNHFNSILIDGDYAAGQSKYVYADIDVYRPEPVYDVELTKTVSTNTANLGDTVTFQIIVFNNSCNDVHNVVVLDTLPVDAAYVAHTPISATYTQVTGLWTVGDLVAGERDTINIDVELTKRGSYFNQAEINSVDELDEDSTPNNLAIATVDEDDSDAACVTVPMLLPCDGSPITLYATDGVAGQWTNNGTDLIGETGATLVVTTPGFYARIDNSSSCPTTSCCTVEVQSQVCCPDLNIFTSTDTVCVGATANIGIDSIPNAVDPINYLWSTGDNSPTISPTSILSDSTFYVTVTDGGACVGIDSILVIVDPAPACSASNNGPICIGQDVILNETGAAAISWSWSGPSGYSSTQQNPTVTAAEAGTYTVLITDSNGCTSSCSTEVLINSGPVCSASNNGPICTGGAVTLSETGVGNTGWSWSGPNSFSSSIQNPTVDPAIAGVYTVVVTDSNGCTSSCETTVVTNNTASCTASNNGPVCGGADVTLDETGGTAISWSWSGPNTFSSNIKNPVVSPAVAGVYTVHVTDSNGCTSTCETTIVINNTPTCSATNSGPICAGDDVILGEDGSDATGWSWTGPNGFSSTLQNPTVPVAEGGVYTVVITDASGCTSSCETTVVRNENPSCTASSTPATCGQSNGSLTAVGADGLGPYSYSLDGGTSSQPLGTFNNLPGGAYTITVIDDNGCTSTCLVNVDVPGGPSCTLTKNDVTCIGVNDGSVSATGTGLEPLEYSIDGVNFQPSGDYTGLAAGFVEITVRDANGCTSLCNVTIDAPTSVSCTLSKTDAGCGSNDGYITALATGGVEPHEFSIDGTTYSTTNTFPNLAPGSYTIQVRDANGCASSCSIDIISDCYDLALTKVINTTATPGPYNAGDNVTFTIEVFNQGAIDATNVEVTDYIPTDMTFANSADFSNTAPHVATIASIPGGTSATVEITLQINPGFQGSSIFNNAEITVDDGDDVDSTPASEDGTVIDSNDNDTADTSGGDDYDPAEVVIGQVYDLALTKVINTTATPGPFGAGDNVTFTIEVFNQGTLDASNVEVTDYIPTDMTFVSSPDFGGTAPHVATIASIPGGTSATVEITLQINPSFQGSSIFNNAEITVDDGDDVDSEPGTEDGSVPDGNDNDTADTGGADDYDPAEVVIGQVYDLALTKVINTTATPGPYSVGDDVTFIIEVFNQGTIDANNVEVTDYIPTDMTFSSSTDFSGTAPHVATIASIPAGTSQTVEITLQINPSFQGSSIVNNAEITADDGNDVDSEPGTEDGSVPDGNDNDTTDTGGADDYDPATVTIGQVYDLALTKVINTTATPGPFGAGDNVTFTIEVFNQGTLDATNVEVTDYVPTDMTFANSSDFSGTAPHVATIASIPAGTSQTVEITLQINPSFQGSSIINNAEITADDGDDVDSEPGTEDGSVPDGNDNDTADTGGADDYDPAAVTIGQVYDLALTKVINTTATPGPYSAGDNVTFTIEVFNQGTMDATNVEVTDYIPTDMTFANSSDFSGTAPHVATIASIPAGTSQTVEITLQINPSFQGSSIVNNAEITADDGDDVDSEPGTEDGSVPDGNDNDTADTGGADDYDPAAVTIGQVYDLALTKVINTTATPGPYSAGDNVTFTIEVFNQGTMDATNVEVTDYIPTDMTFANSSDFNGAAPHVATIASIPAGTSQTVEITLQINPSFQGSSIVNNAEITADDGDDVDSEPGTEDGSVPDGNDNDTADTGGSDDYDPAAITIGQVYDLALTKVINTTATPGPYSAGDNVTFTIEVFNQGTLDATNVEVTDYIPTDMTFANSSDFSGTAPHVATIASIPAGTSQTVEITLQINPSFQGSSIVNNAEITADDGDDVDSEPGTEDGSVPDGNDNDTADTGGADDYDPAAITIGQVYDLALTKVINATATPGPYSAGDNVTFTIEVFNQGTLDATNVEVTDYIPTDMTYANSSDFSGTAPHVATIASIPAGTSQTVEITLQINPSFQGSSIVNNAEITADDGDDVDSEPGTEDGSVPDGNDNDTADTGGADDYDPAAVTVGQTYDLALTKVINTVATPGPYSPGDNVAFTIEVFNQGSIDANNVEVTDYIPTGFTFANSTDFSGSAPHTATISSIAAGTSATVGITLQIDANFQGSSIVNNAEITADDGDDVDSEPGTEDGTVPDGNDNDTADTGGADDYDPAAVPVEQLYDLDITKSIITSGPFSPGSTVVFEIIVKNTGNLDASNIVVNEYSDQALTYVSMLPDINLIDNSNESFTILSLPAAGSQSIRVTYNIDPAFMGTSINNDVAITNDDGNDIDSNPDTGNDIDEDGDGNPDDDDEDGVILVVEQEYDLALTKVLTSVGPFRNGDDVTFTISVFNQGTINASNIEIIDYIPAGMSLSASDNNGWVLNADGTASVTLPTVPVGVAPTTVNIVLSINQDFQGTMLTNVAEISSDDGDDIDSAPDTNNTDPFGGDNVIDNSVGDEDDHDPAEIQVEQIFDLALIKTISTPGPYYPGGDIVFTLDVTNQGTVDATTVELVDFIPSGLILNDPNWIQTAGGSANLVGGLINIPAGTSRQVDIAFTIDPDINQLTVENIAEISSATNVLGLPDIDSNPDGTNSDVIGGDNETGGAGGDEDDHDPASFMIEIGGIGNKVWKDLNGNGIYEVGEPGVENVVVFLYRCLSTGQDSTVAFARTDSNGDFLFTGLVPGDYRLGFDYSSIAAGCTWIDPNQGTDDAIDSDVDEFGLTECTTISPGEIDNSWYAGLVPVAGLGNYVWEDLNGDGIQDSNEPPIEGILVELYDQFYDLVASTFTDENGGYFFDDLRAGDYFVKFRRPNGYDFTLTFQGTNTDADSDVDNSNGFGTTPFTTIEWGEIDPTWDAGFHRCIQIGDYAWYDTNENDIYDENEKGINGLIVSLYRNVNGEWVKWDQETTGQHPLNASGNGYYKFCAPPGTYYLHFKSGPAGMVPVIAGVGGVEEDSDLTGANGPNTTNTFTVVTGDERCDLGAGYYPMASAGTLVWMDTNSDGIKSPNEGVAQGVKVEAYDIHNDLIKSTTTDDNGEYMLDYLRKESYYLKFYPPVGYSMTAANVTNDEDVDSDVDHSNGLNTTAMYQMSPGEHIPNINAGLITGSILPVSLVSFDGVYRDHYNYLTWNTSSEINVDYFILEKKFEEETGFTSIGRLPASGSSFNYSMEDYDIDQTGQYYYRLKMVDKDGSVDYSDIISIFVRSKSSDSVSLYPNPATAEVNLEVSVSKDSKVNVDIYNSTGQLVRKSLFSKNVKKGKTILSIDLEGLIHGVYNVQLNLDGQIISKKLILLDN